MRINEWLTASYPWFNAFHVVPSRRLSLREDNADESGEILNMLLQPYTRDDDSPGEVRRKEAVCAAEGDENTVKEGTVDARICWETIWEAC